MTIPVIVSRYYLDKKASFQEDAGQIIVSAPHQHVCVCAHVALDAPVLLGTHVKITNRDANARGIVSC